MGWLLIGFISTKLIGYQNKRALGLKMVSFFGLGFATPFLAVRKSSRALDEC